MNPHDIKAALGKKGVTMTAVARYFDVSLSAVHLIVFGRGRSKRIEKRIAQLTDIPLESLWPQWYSRKVAA